MSWRYALVRNLCAAGAMWSTFALTVVLAPHTHTVIQHWTIVPY